MNQFSTAIDFDFAQGREVLADVAELVRPARKIASSEFASKHVYIDDGVLWDPTETPYMCRPMDLINAREYESIVFMGPARTGKTLALLDCSVAHIACNDPGDTLVSQMTQDLARSYSRKRIDRMNKYSPELAERIRLGTNDDNTHDKLYRSGMHLVLGWPSPSQYASRDFRYVFITDYDRIPLDIGGEGSAFVQVQKRLQTYMSRGMGVYESSPKHEVKGHEWKPQTAHEMPPAAGITSLFNRGTREVFYFQCFKCKDWFVPDFPEVFWWPESDDIAESAGGVMYVCPHCGVMTEPSRKSDFNARGRWCGDGQRLSEDGQLIGDPVDSAVASFRLGAGAAAYQKAEQLVRALLQAERDYELTGDEGTLRGHVGLDQGKPYKPKRTAVRRSADDLMRRIEDYESIPEGVRFIKAIIDIQKNHFAVLFVGCGVGMERWVLERMNIRRSKRTIDGAVALVEPGVFVEDWHLLIDQVINRRFPLGDGRTMGIKLTGCDSAGEAGVTERAYEFYRHLWREGFADRFALVKGGSRTGTPRIRETYPDSGKRKDRKAQARGEIPVFMLNTELLKDALSQDLARTEHGPLYIHFCESLPESFYDEITSEVKDPRKGWIQPSRKQANEAWDCLTYDRALNIPLGLERADFWENPPPWARAWDQNSLVSDTPGTVPPSTPPAATRRRVRSGGIRRV